jgi:hypothetical protein
MFILGENESEEFVLAPGAEVESIRGVFFIDVIDENSAVSLKIYDNGILIHSFA